MSGGRSVGRNTPGRGGPGVCREGYQQCLIRDANEAIERLNIKLTMGVGRLELRCECGDPACLDRVLPTHDEYEAVRAYGSRFIVHVNHENPETASVVNENVRFAIVEVVAGEARYQALARNTRHAWVDAAAPDDETGRQLPAPERSLS
jgi:hypothetical protein